MSLDLSWSLLDEAFTAQIIDKLNDVLANASRPEYIGPIRLSNLVLGHEAPDVSIVDVGDVWQTFLQRDEASMNAAASSARANDNAGGGHTVDHRFQRYDDQHQDSTKQGAHRTRRDGNLARFANKNLPFSAVPPDSPGLGHDDDVDDMGNDIDARGLMQPSSQFEIPTRRHSRRRIPAHRRIETYRQYSDSGHAHRVDAGSVSSFDAYSSLQPSGMATPSAWGAGLPHAAQGGYFSAWQGASMPSLAGAPITPSIRSVPQSQRTSWQRQASISAMSKARHPSPGVMPNYGAGAPSYASWSQAGVNGYPADSPVQEESAPSGNSLPSLQLQLSLHWTTQSLRLTLDTSLVINHPSPAFMSLPLTITITGLSLAAGGLLAFEVDPVTNVRRSHFCLLVEEEGEGEDDLDEAGQVGEHPGNGHAKDPRLPPSSLRRDVGPAGGPDGQPTAGERILYSLSLETSVGQADKHVLKNVAKVERFVVSLARKAIGDELIYPNFYSVEVPS